MSFRWSDFVGSRVKVAPRDESSAWIPESQDFAKVKSSGFHENREKAVSWEIMLFEVGFFSYSGSFLSKGMCVSKGDAVQFSLRPHDCILAITWLSLIQIE